MNRIQQIFTDHGQRYLEQFGDRVPGPHRKVISAIRACRTGGCGHHLFQCCECDRTHVAPSSCGNRHCPVCQNDKAAHWVHRHQQKLLPCEYFLVTFTVPEALRRVIRSHPRKGYAALMACAAQSLKTLEADPRFVGCPSAGFTAVLHTWTRQLEYHPHVHVIVPGGGLSSDRLRWIDSREGFLIHVRALSRMFRVKMRAHLHEQGLNSVIDPSVWTQEWVVHCKAVGSGHKVLKYLGAYVFRVAISEARILEYDGKRVRFKYQKSGSSRWRTLSLPVLEFMRRYLQHVLPSGFTKVRHYGFLSPNFSLSLHRIREMICVLYETLRAQLRTEPLPEKPKPLRCTGCSARMQWVKFIPPIPATSPP